MSGLEPGCTYADTFDTTTMHTWTPIKRKMIAIATDCPILCEHTPYKRHEYTQVKGAYTRQSRQPCLCHHALLGLLWCTSSSCGTGSNAWQVRRLRTLRQNAVMRPKKTDVLSDEIWLYILRALQGDECTRVLSAWGAEVCVPAA